MKSIVVYYSRKGENYVNGSIVNLKEGNTAIAAGMISNLTSSDIFEMIYSTSSISGTSFCFIIAVAIYSSLPVFFSVSVFLISYLKSR